MSHEAGFTPREAAGEQRQRLHIGSHVSLAELTPLVESRVVNATRHETAPLTVYNYSERIAQHRGWTPLAEFCRGLILDDEGKIVARPFGRIHDLGPDESLPDRPFTVQEKLDGTLGIQYWADGVPYLATRRAFTDSRGRTRLTDANAKLQEYAGQYQFDPNLTYLWEIIDSDYPQVVDYPETKDIYLIGMQETATGRNIPLPEADTVPFHVVESFSDITTTEQLRERVEQRPNTEGFVIVMDDGERWRIKSKGYHWRKDIKDGVVRENIWKAFYHDEPVEAIVEAAPDEVKELVFADVLGFAQQYLHLEAAATRALAEAREQGIRIDRTAQRQRFFNHYRDTDYRAALDILFRNPNPEDYRRHLLTLIRPPRTRSR